MFIAACPKCGESVCVEGGLAGEAEVRCPLCQAEYRFAEVLEKLPPRLVVLSAPVPVAAAAAAEASWLASDLALAGGDGESELLLQSEGPAETGLAETGQAASGEMELQEAPEKPFSFDEAPAPAFAPAPVSGAPVRRKKSVSPIYTIVGVVLGGVMAFPLAAIILWWLPGAWSRDLMEIGAPVSKYAPWLVPAKYHGKPKANDSANMAASTGGPKVANGGAKAEPQTKAPQGSGLANNFGVDGKPVPENGTIPPAGPSGNDLTVTPDLTNPLFDPSATVPGVGEPGKQPGAGSGDPLTNLPDFGEPSIPAKKTPDERPSLEPGPGTEPATPDPLLPNPVPEPKSPDNGKAPGKGKLPGEEKPANPPDESPAVAAKHPVKNSPSFAALDISAALESAAAAEKAWDTLAADAPLDVKQETAHQFRDALAQLAQTSTFPDGDELPADLAQKITQQLAALAGDATKTSLIAASAASTLRTTKGLPSGVLLAGQVKEIKQVGDLYEVKLALLNKAQTPVVLLTAADPQAAYPVEAKVLVLGSILEDPASSVRGYQGEQTQVVWGGMVYAVRADSQP